MFHKFIPLTIGIWMAACPVLVFGQAKPAPQFFVVCASQMNEPTVYFSGVLQGPAAALSAYRAGFNEYLIQHYAYKGAVECAPTNTAANAQTFVTARSTALRNAKKNVVDTGWTESAGAIAPVASALSSAPSIVPQIKAAAIPSPVPSAPTAATAAAAAAPASGGAASPAPLTSVLSSIFGAPGGSGAGAPKAAGQAASGSTATSGAATSGGGGVGQSPFQQVSSALTSVFGAKSSSGSASTNAAPKAPASTPADGALGSAQAQNTKLIVYGCGRQDTQVACVTELANQNQKDTLVQAGDVWKDAFIVDDRGDRHQRTSGFFLNVDGDQRPQLDIAYGKTARFVLMFDGVQTKVQKVALRSVAGGLDVEEIGLVSASAGAAH